MDLETGSQPADAPALTTPTVAYHGRLGEAWKLAIKTTFLTIVTLGVYRFWAKTRIRQYFWSRITIDGEPLEYAGTGLELFLGFLIIIAIVAPLYAVMSVGQLFLVDSPALAAAASLLPVLILLALIPVAVFRARRYRLSRTVWRGVRAGQTGGTGQYWIRAVGYGLVGWLTLGLLRPLAHARLTSFLMNNTWFGQTPFKFQVRARDLMWRWVLFWVLFVGVYAVALGGSYLLSETVEYGGGEDVNVPPLAMAFDIFDVAQGKFIAFIVATIGMAVAAAAAYLHYNVFKARLFAQRTTFDQLGFSSSIRFWRIVGIYALMYLMFAVLVGGLSALTGALFAQEGGFIGLILGGFLAGTLFAPFIVHPLLAHFVEMLTLDGKIDLDAIARNAQTAPKTGEGLASAFDVDAF